MTLDLFRTQSRTAVISPCGRYRYRLDDPIRDGDRKVCWVMLNPSTADATNDDPTLVRCINFAAAWGFGSLVLVNLFAWRATDPRELTKAGDPVGPDADLHIRAALSESAMVVCGWGGSGPKRLTPGRTAEVLRLIEEAGLVPMALAKTKAGAPKHPLYLKGDLRPRPLADVE